MQLPASNRRVTLSARPNGIPQAEHFVLDAVPLVLPGPGQVVIENHYLSVDPAMRGWVSAEVNYIRSVPIGGVMRASAVGRVIASRNGQLPVGEMVVGRFGWQEYATVGAADVLRTVDPDLPPSLALGVLGATGITAWLGLMKVGQPTSGDVVVVSTAAGAVGSVVGQLARLAGCRTVGITGSPAKVRVCDEEYGFDIALDYHSPTFKEDLGTACSDGADVYFDNTSGWISDAVLPHLRKHARVVICGTAAISSWDPLPEGPRVSRHLLTKSARMEGFLLQDYAHLHDEALERLTPLVRSGAITTREHVLDGIESAPGSIAALYRGDNLGKAVIRLR
jgi:NADPH-dependent curcumin reductase CurA